MNYIGAYRRSDLAKKTHSVRKTHRHLRVCETSHSVKKTHRHIRVCEASHRLYSLCDAFLYLYTYVFKNESYVMPYKNYVPMCLIKTMCLK